MEPSFVYIPWCAIIRIPWCAIIRIPWCAELWPVNSTYRKVVNINHYYYHWDLDRE